MVVRLHTVSNISDDQNLSYFKNSRNNLFLSLKIPTQLTILKRV